jgi:hypothetical protein
MNMPGGSDGAEKVTGGSEGESLAWTARLTGLPPDVPWSPGDVTFSVPLQYQVKVTDVEPAPFVAVIVTWLELGVDGAVPVIWPVVVSSVTVGGKPVSW